MGVQLTTHRNQGPTESVAVVRGQVGHQLFTPLAMRQRRAANKTIMPATKTAKRAVGTHGLPDESRRRCRRLADRASVAGVVRLPGHGTTRPSLGLRLRVPDRVRWRWASLKGMSLSEEE